MMSSGMRLPWIIASVLSILLVAAAVLDALSARREGDRRWMATAAIVLAGLCLAQMAVYSVVAAVS